MQEKVSAQYKNEIEMAKSQRDYELKKSVYDMEVNTKKAESEMAYDLQVKSSFESLPPVACWGGFSVGAGTFTTTVVSVEVRARSTNQDSRSCFCLI